MLGQQVRVELGTADTAQKGCRVDLNILFGPHCLVTVGEMDFGKEAVLSDTIL